MAAFFRALRAFSRRFRRRRISLMRSITLSPVAGGKSGFRPAKRPF
jgi:hypothetical protein